jgi:N-acetylglucosaminyldiphosphoundecaprenol N-acetyl-beta-D-mannosaminyltransferase
LPASPLIAAAGAPIPLFGVPFDDVTTAQTVALVEQMIQSERPHYLVTANVDFLAQALADVELRRILFEAHLVLCDGTPLLWASRWLGSPLRERVAGSDLVPLLIRLAAEKQYRLFFLGGTAATTSDAVSRLRAQYPTLHVAGHYSPPFHSLLEMDHDEIKRRIQAARPHVLFVCFGCPKQEKWIAMHYRSLEVPVSIGVGGTIDFLAGRFPRAPIWMRRTGVEWIFRLAQEPRRLFKRYVRDGWFFGRMVLAQWCRMRLRRRPPPITDRVRAVRHSAEIQCPEWLDAEAVRQDAKRWDELLSQDGHCLLDLSNVRFIDSTGVGLLIRFRKRAGRDNRQVILIAPSWTVTRVLNAMRLWPFFLTAPDASAARAMLERFSIAEPAALRPGDSGLGEVLAWNGEVTAGNANAVWRLTEAYIRSRGLEHLDLTIELSGVRFIDSTGLGLMVRSKKEAASQGVRLRFAGINGNVRNVMRISRLEEYLLGFPGT